LVNKKYYVYIWYIKETNEIFYVGKGSGNRYKSMKDRNAYFKNIRKKYDCDCKIIKYFDNESEAYDYELELGTRLKEQGQARACYILGQTNKYVSGEIKKKISKTLQGNIPWCKGRKLTESHKEKIRKAHLGKKQSEEHRKAISKALMGHTVKKETREKLSQSKIGENNPMYGKKQSQEVINKRVEKLIGHTTSDETKKKIGLANGKKVAQIDIASNNIIRIFDSASEAARVLGLQNSKISAVCRGTRNKAGGFRWEYV